MYFWICKKYALIVLKNRWKNNLNLLLKGTSSELKEIIKGKLGENKLGIISSWNDYFIKVSIISKNISEAENLTSILIWDIFGVLSDESSKIISQLISKNLLSKINLVIELGDSFLFKDEDSIILSTIFSEEYFESFFWRYSIALLTLGILLHSLKIKVFSIVFYLF